MPPRRVRAAPKEEDEKEPAEVKEKSDQPSLDSLEKLAKLEPLPKLMQEFDLDAHVGLIDRLLKEDKKLVEMQSELSGKWSFEFRICCPLFEWNLTRLNVRSLQAGENVSASFGGIIFSTAPLRATKQV